MRVGGSVECAIGSTADPASALGGGVRGRSIPQVVALALKIQESQAHGV